MYQPPHFRIEDRETMLDAIRAHPLGLLVTAGPGGLVANPVPFILAGDGERTLLRCHLARPNAQWREIAAGAQTMVVFQGVDRYVTPSWYATKRESGKVVPTWNYVMVQVRGPARVTDDPEWLMTQISALTDMHEGPRAEPWAVSDAPADFVRAQARGIVGVEIEAAEIAGKWKVSQNRNEADRDGVAAGLRAEPDAAAEAMAALVAARGQGAR